MIPDWLELLIEEVREHVEFDDLPEVPEGFDFELLRHQLAAARLEPLLEYGGVRAVYDLHVRVLGGGEVLEEEWRAARSAAEYAAAWAAEYAAAWAAEYSARPATWAAWAATWAARAAARAAEYAAEYSALSAARGARAAAEYSARGAARGAVWQRERDNLIKFMGA